MASSSALFEVNPDFDKRIADGDFGDRNRGRVKPGWLLMSRSGQVYGLLGSVTLSTDALNDYVISDHVIRIAPNGISQVRVGYLQTVLSHPVLGRQVVKSLAYGSSIPSIEPDDMATFSFVRLDESEEAAIADFAEEAARQRGLADSLERTLSQEAGALLDRFIAGHGTAVLTG